MNPLTILSFAASAWILILGVNNSWLSAFFLVAALLWRRVLVPTALLVLPMALSLAVIHIPFGHAHLAAELALRCAALVAVALAAFSTFTIADLAKAMQATRAPANLSYILGSALRILPEGRATFEKVRYAQHLAYRRRVLFRNPHLVSVVQLGQDHGSQQHNYSHNDKDRRQYRRAALRGDRLGCPIGRTMLRWFRAYPHHVRPPRIVVE